MHTAAFAQREFGSVTPDQGFMWDEPSCPLSSAYMKDLTQIDTLVGHAARIQAPWLLVHGSEDDVVPIQDSRDILAKANRDVTGFVEIPGSNHVFAGNYAATMVKVVSDWISARFAT